MNEIQTDEYKSFIEELQSAITEIEYGARDYLIRGYHEIGKFVASHRYDLPTVARDSNVPLRTIQRCKQFYEKYPDMNALPLGKNISWHKICNELLPEHTDKPKEEYIVCDKCAGRGKIKI